MEKWWQQSMLQKIDVILEAIKENYNNIFVYSDVDIIFFQKISQDLLSRMNQKNADILFQSDCYDSSYYNAGFFACRANETTLALWKECREKSQEAISHRTGKNEQDILNEMLNLNEKMITFWCLPWDKYYTPKERIINLNSIPPIPDNICIYHANWLIGVKNKQILLWKVQKMRADNQCISSWEYTAFCKNRVKQQQTLKYLFVSFIHKWIFFIYKKYSVICQSLKTLFIISEKSPENTISCADGSKNSST